MYTWNTETVNLINNSLKLGKKVSVILHENIGARINEHKITKARLCDVNQNEIEIQLNNQSFIPITERDLIFVRN